MAPLPARSLDRDQENSVTLQEKPLADPELVYTPRPVTGLFATLTAEQKR
jgi:hypothetical protein